MATATQDAEARRPACPECGTEVQSTWRWCLACGFDPDGLRELHERRKPTPEDIEAEAGTGTGTGTGWTVAVLLVGLLLAGSLYYARTRSSTVSDGGAIAIVEVTTTTASWTLFQSPEGAYSLFVPAAPTIESYEVPFGGAARTFHNATATFGDDSFTVSYLDGDAAEAALPPAERLRTFATNYATVIGGTPAQQTDVSVDGNPALDFSFDLKGLGRNRSRAVIKGPRTYVISIIGANPSFEDFDHMVTSFHLQ